MLKSNSLKIGNWILAPNECPMQVKNIQENSINLLIDGEGVSGSYNLDNFSGIELNPVNLLKCGFALGDGYYWKTWGKNGVFIVKFDTVYNKFFVEAGKGFNLLVEYVHELQNAFYVFSLGRELEVVW